MLATQLGRVTFLMSLLFFPLLSLAYAPPLTLSGATTSGEKISITLERSKLESLPQSSLSTRLPWFEGTAEFEGVLLSDLLNTYSLSYKTITVTALNDYQVDVSQQYLDEFNPLIAIKKNGKYLKVRNYGPYWLVASIDAYPELAQTEHLGKMVWQIEFIETKQ
ncbi:oxidoreductase [Photobacterium minamisatsumaniensis]|uniref:oxidoreductase n=1 Tax=Photobacterium minamisatsumaniensis TaxID=2910233 RepID=UPI003D11D8C7